MAFTLPGPGALFTGLCLRISLHGKRFVTNTHFQKVNSGTLFFFFFVNEKQRFSRPLRAPTLRWGVRGSGEPFRSLTHVRRVRVDGVYSPPGTITCPKETWSRPGRKRFVRGKLQPLTTKR